jgi:hypothetical protein
VREVAGLLTDVDIGPGSRRRDPEALPQPGLGRRRPVVPERLGPVRLADGLEDQPVGRGPDAEQHIEISATLRVRQGLCLADQIRHQRGHRRTILGHRT